jgi:hypothetical protein
LSGLPRPIMLSGLPRPIMLSGLPRPTDSDYLQTLLELDVNEVL